MKSINRLFLLTALFSVFSVTAPIYESAKENSKLITQVQAATSVDEYYSSKNTSSASSLFSSLRSIINAGWVQGSYDKLLTSYASTDMKDGYLVDIYSNTSKFTMNGDTCGNYSKENDCWNREHTIPKSWWGGAKAGPNGEGGDLFMMYPTDGKVNGMRSNYPLGDVVTKTNSSNNDFSLFGTGSVGDATGLTVFEPNDQYKGDMARIYFYAATKYSGSKSYTSGNGSTVFGNSEFSLTSNAAKLFVAWNKLDPVDDWELGRCDRVQAIQANRNPYIDHPEWANYIFGGEALGNDPVSSVALSSHQETIRLGGTVQLNATVLPSTAGDKSLTWSSTNSSVASVSSSGLVTSISEGTTTITATSNNDSLKKDSALITVTNETIHVTSISLTSPSSIFVGADATIGVVFTPSESTNTNYTLESSNTNVLSITNLTTVHANAIGISYLTATSEDGGFISKVMINVKKTSQVDTSLTIDNFALSSSYAWQTWTSGEISGEAYIYGGTKDKMQFNNSKASYYLFNKTPISGGIKSISVTLASGSADWEILTSSTSYSEVSSVPNTGTSQGIKNLSTSEVSWAINSTDAYFTLNYKGSGACYISKVVVSSSAASGDDVQSKAYEYVSTFLSTTQTECNNLNVSSSTWSSLATSYSALSDDVKNYICNNASSDETIKLLIARHDFIANKYGFEKFIKNSEGVLLSNYAYNAGNENKIMPLAITLISCVIVISFVVFLIVKRQKRHS